MEYFLVENFGVFLNNTKNWKNKKEIFDGKNSTNKITEKTSKFQKRVLVTGNNVP